MHDNCFNYNNGICNITGKQCLFEWPSEELCAALFGGRKKGVITHVN